MHDVKVPEPEETVVVTLAVSLGTLEGAEDTDGVEEIESEDLAALLGKMVQRHGQQYLLDAGINLRLGGVKVDDHYVL